MLCFCFPPSNKPRQTFACLIAHALYGMWQSSDHTLFFGGERVTFLLCTIRKHLRAQNDDGCERALWYDHSDNSYSSQLSCAPGTAVLVMA